MARVGRFVLIAFLAGTIVLVPGLAQAAGNANGPGSDCVTCWPGWN